MEDDSDLSELSGTEDENAAIPASSDLTRSTKRRSRDRKRRSKCSKGSTAKAKFLHNQSYALKKRDDGLTNGEVSHQPADIHFPVKTGQNNHTHELRCEVDALQRRKDLGMGDVVTLPEVGTLILWKDEKQTELVYHRADVLKSEDTESLHDLIQYLMKNGTHKAKYSLAIADGRAKEGVPLKRKANSQTPKAKSAVDKELDQLLGQIRTLRIESGGPVGIPGSAGEGSIAAGGRRSTLEGTSYMVGYWKRNGLKTVSASADYRQNQALVDPILILYRNKIAPRVASMMFSLQPDVYRRRCEAYIYSLYENRQLFQEYPNLMISPCVTCIALKLGPTDMPHKDVGDAGNILGHVLSPRKKGAALWKGAQVQFTDHGVAIPINGTQVCVANYKENRHYSRPLSEGLPTDRVVVVGLTDRDCIPKYVFDLPVKECILRDLGKPIMLCPDSAAAQIIYGPVKYGPADLKRKLDALWESGRPIEATPESGCASTV